jgi:SPP1 gp7 family putative phage head morphogenesis protein
MPLTAIRWPRGHKAAIQTPAIRAIAAKLEPKARRLFLAAVASLSDAIDLEAIAQSVMDGTLAPSVLTALREWSAKLAPLVSTVTSAFYLAGSASAETLADALSIRFSFNLSNPRAASWAAKYSYELVKDLTDTTQAGLQSVIGRAFTDGIPPAEAGRMIRPLIGLTEHGTTAVGHYWEALVKEGRTAEEVARLSRRYSDKLLRARALLIARTETIRTANEGQQETWRQAVEEGYLDKATMKREWWTADDERRCDACGSLHGQQVGLEELFTDMDGETYERPPAHPACRCSVAAIPGNAKPANLTPR